jgi:hypothetical protein
MEFTRYTQIIFSILSIHFYLQTYSFYNNYSPIDYQKTAKNICLQLECHSLEDIFFSRYLQAAHSESFELLTNPAKKIILDALEKHINMLENNTIQNYLINRCLRDMKKTGYLYKKISLLMQQSLPTHTENYMHCIDELLIIAMTKILSQNDQAITNPDFVDFLNTQIGQDKNEALHLYNTYLSLTEKMSAPSTASAHTPLRSFSINQQIHISNMLCLLKQQLNITTHQPLMNEQFENETTKYSFAINKELIVGNKAEIDAIADLDPNSDIRLALAKPTLSRHEAKLLQQTLNNLFYDKTPPLKNNQKTYIFHDISIPHKTSRFSFTQFLKIIDTLNSPLQLLIVSAISAGIYGLYKFSMHIMLLREHDKKLNKERHFINQKPIQKKKFF